MKKIRIWTKWWKLKKVKLDAKQMRSLMILHFNATNVYQVDEAVEILRFRANEAIKEVKLLCYLYNNDDFKCVNTHVNKSR